MDSYERRQICSSKVSYYTFIKRSFIKTGVIVLNKLNYVQPWRSLLERHMYNFK